MKKLLTLVLILISATGYSQVHRYVKVQYDSSKIVTPYALSTALAPQTVTYAQLLTAISAKTLISDRSYILSDFRTVYKVYGGIDTTSGSVEPLILTATSDSTISITAFSPKYPNDVIHYSVTDNSPLAPTSGSKGVILFRKDALNNISTYYDWRVVKWRRWALAAGGIYLAFTKNTPAIATDSSMSFTFGTNNTNISIGGDSWNIVIGDNNNSIKIGSDVGIFGSGVNIGNNNRAITIDDECAPVETTGSGYIGGINILSSNTYINIGKRSYNISIGSSCYAIDIGLQNSDISVPNNTIRKRIEKGFSNFEVTVALTDKKIDLYNTMIYSVSPYLYNTAHFCGIINLTSANPTDTLDFISAQTTSLAFSDIWIRPASGLSLLVRDKSVATTIGSNIDFGGANLLVNGTEKKYFKIHKNITNTYGIQPADFYLSYTNVASGGSFVPYTGATQDVNLGEFGLQAGNVEFDNTPTNLPTTAGSMYYNDNDGTLDLILKGGNVKLQIGQETVLRVVNKTATNINLLEANYQAVRVTGAQGQRSKVDLAQATSDTFSAETIGLVTETINNNQEGYITTSGLVRNINTTGSLQGETWADGDMLYLSPTTAGSLTKVKPVAPNHLVVIGYVIHAHITQGSVFVKVDNGYELDELHNVKITTPINNQALIFNDTTDIWENKTMIGAIDTTKIPLSGTVVGKPITGDLEIDNLAGNKRIKGNASSSYIEFTDDGGININETTGSNVNVMGVTFNGQNLVGSDGMTGVKNYSANYVPLTYIQKVYSDSITNLKLNKSDTAAMLSPYQRDITLTTTGSSGAATFNQTTGALNIPNYTSAGGGVTSLSAIGSTPNANGATITGSILNLQPASATFGGVLTTGTQSIAGAKKFEAGVEALGSISLADGANTIASIFNDGGVGVIEIAEVGGTGITQYGKTSLVLTNGVGGAGGINTTNLTAARDYQMPDNSGTFALLSDTTTLSNRIDLKLNKSDTATMLTPYELKNKNWGLLGNAGTNASTNFIGTTDNVDFEIRRNNITALKLYTSNVRMAANDFPNLTTGTRNLFLGSSNRNTILDNRVTSGVRNISVISGGYTNTIGNDNISIGANSNINNSLTNTTGNNNIAIGASAGTSGITSGNDNISVGRSANDNLYLGGSRNIAIGVYSNKQWAGGYAANGTQGSRNIIIGDSINLPVGNSSNQLNIGNMIYGNGLNGYEETISTGNIGIGVKIPAQKLEVAGNIKLTGLAFENTDTLATKAYARSVGGGGGGGVTSLSAIGAAPNANGATITGSVLNLQPASATFGGVLTTGSQSIAGAKQFQSGLEAFGGINLTDGTNSIASMFNDGGVGLIELYEVGGTGVAQYGKSFLTLSNASGGLGTINTTNLTALRNYEMPNNSGTFALLSDTATLSNRINLKQNLVTLTTTGASGAATFNQSTGALNIPNYAGATLNIEQVLTNGNDAAQIQIKNVAAGTDPEDAVVLIQVSDSLNTKLYLSDTSAMLTPYAKKASPTFTGTVTLPAGQVVNGVTLTTGGGTTNFLRADGTYAAPTAGASVDSLNDRYSRTQQVSDSSYRIIKQNGKSTLYVYERNRDNVTANAAGATTEIQYNLAGVTSSSPAFTYDPAQQKLGLTGQNSEVLMKSITIEPAAPADSFLHIYTKKVAGKMELKTKGPSGLDYPLQAALWMTTTTDWSSSTATAGLWRNTAGTGAGTFTAALPTDVNVYTSMKRSRYANVVNTANQVLGQRNTENMFFRGSAVSGAGGFRAVARGGMDVWTNGGRFFFGMATANTVITADPSALNNTVGFAVDVADNGLIHFITKNTGVVQKVSTGFTFANNTGFDFYIFCSPNASQYSWRIVSLQDGTEANGIATLQLPVNTTKQSVNFLASNAALTPVTSVQLGLQKINVETDY